MSMVLHFGQRCSWNPVLKKYLFYQKHAGKDEHKKEEDPEFAPVVDVGVAVHHEIQVRGQGC